MRMNLSITKMILNIFILVAVLLNLYACSLVPSSNPTSQLAGNCSLLVNKLGAPLAYNSKDRYADYIELKRDMDNCLSDARMKLRQEGVYINEN